MKTTRKYLIKAIMFSVLLHLLFVLISGLIHIGKLSAEFVKTHEVFKVKASDPKLSKPTRKIDIKDSHKSTNVIDASQSVDHIAKSLEGKFKENKEQPKVVEDWTPDLEKTKEPKSMKEFGQLQKEVTPVQKVQNRPVPETLTVLGDDALKSKAQEATSPALMFDTTKNEDMIEMVGFTPSYHGPSDDKAEPWQAMQPFTTESSLLQGGSPGFEDVNQHLLCELLTFKDPIDGEKYFQVRIRAGKKIDELKRIPKEIVFLLDSSLSIQNDRLQEFKKGLAYALAQLDSKDMFNVSIFREEVGFLSTDSMSPTPQNIKKAISYIDQVTSGQGTDTYGAFFQSIHAPNKMDPSYLFLLSDGKPTLGELDSTKIIREISRINDGKKGIFAFSGGARVNRYLLDFISYKNRGWSEYSSKGYQISAYLMRMLDKIKDPILLNVRYNLGGVDPREVYPKVLPDFFRNAEINLYGKYKDEDRIILRFLADREGKTHELEVETSFSQAQEGDASIMQNWAYNKIYDLIGRMDDSSKFDELLKEVQNISEKFDIQTPYTERRKKD